MPSGHEKLAPGWARQVVDARPAPTLADSARRGSGPAKRKQSLTPKQWLTLHQGALIGTGAVIVFVVIWQIIASMRIESKLFLPGPSDIIAAFGDWSQHGMASDLWTSAQEFLLGYLVAVVIGLPVGFFMGWFKKARFALDPFVSFLYSSPRIAFIPLFIIWLGIGVKAKIAIVAMGAVFPIIISVSAGLRNIDHDLVTAARSFAASEAQVFRKIALPSSVPFILTGLRLGVGHAIVGVFVGELFAATRGVGFMMTNAASTFATARVFAGLIVLAGAGILLQTAIQVVEKRFQAWRPASR